MAISPYVAGLRALIGHRQLLLPSVALLIWDDAGRLLMVQDAPTGLWQTVGGAVEPLEPPQEAAEREALEETGLEVAITGIRGLAGGPAYQHVYPNGDAVAFAGVVFDAQVAGGTLLYAGDDDEVSAAQWWEPDALRTAPMTELTRTLLTQMGVWDVA